MYSSVIRFVADVFFALVMQSYEFSVRQRTVSQVKLGNVSIIDIRKEARY